MFDSRDERDPRSKHWKGGCPRGEPGGGPDSTHIGADYDADELELLRAVDAFRRRTGRKFPSVVEVMLVMKSLGWMKTCSS